MKYVAFIDTLGFKQRVNEVTHEEAKNIIRRFNQSVFNLWRVMNLNHDHLIKGRTFSDSILIHSEGESIHELNKIIDFLVELYRLSIIECELPLRGGIAIGDFDDINAVELDNLQKGLVVGSAFIEAYQLESSYNVKGSKLLFGQEINFKIERELNDFETNEVTEYDGRTIYELKWGDLIYLTENNYKALNKFIGLATESGWLDHHFGTLETFLIKESRDDKREIYARIIQKLRNDYKYNDLDNFIENYMKSNIAVYTKKSFLAYLRESI